MTLVEPRFYIDTLDEVLQLMRKQDFLRLEIVEEAGVCAQMFHKCVKGELNCFDTRWDPPRLWRVDVDGSFALFKSWPWFIKQRGFNECSCLNRDYTKIEIMLTKLQVCPT